MSKLIISMLLFSILLFGCLGEPEVPEEPEGETPPGEDVTIPMPSFTIVSPAAGAVVKSAEENAEVTVSVSAMNLIIKTPGGAAKKGEGHFHFMLDGGNAIVVSEKTYTLTGINPGTHTLRIELMNNDHTAYSPPIVKEVTFTVEYEPAEYLPQEYTVKIKDFAFEPAQITVNVDDVVTWVNEGAYPRSATCYLNGVEIFDSDIIGPGEQASVTMKKAVTCEYYALTYMAMKGHITVEPHD
ncbi:MAG: plastocyanin/azurin family copper-binding protein [Candidatus Micrarchaeota archaeon]